MVSMLDLLTDAAALAPAPDSGSARAAQKLACPRSGPSRKFTCRHARGLLHAANRGEWTQAPPPTLTRWLGGRLNRAEKAAQVPEAWPRRPAW